MSYLDRNITCMDIVHTQTCTRTHVQPIRDGTTKNETCQKRKTKSLGDCIVCKRCVFFWMALEGVYFLNSMDGVCIGCGC